MVGWYGAMHSYFRTMCHMPCAVCDDSSQPENRVIPAAFRISFRAFSGECTCRLAHQIETGDSDRESTSGKGGIPSEADELTQNIQHLTAQIASLTQVCATLAQSQQTGGSRWAEKPRRQHQYVATHQ